MGWAKRYGSPEGSEGGGGGAGVCAACSDADLQDYSGMYVS